MRTILHHVYLSSSSPHPKGMPPIPTPSFDPADAPPAPPPADVTDDFSAGDDLSLTGTIEEDADVLKMDALDVDLSLLEPDSPSSSSSDSSRDPSFAEDHPNSELLAALGPPPPPYGSHPFSCRDRVIHLAHSYLLQRFHSRLEILSNAFAHFDLNADGSISAREIFAFLEQRGLEQPCNKPSLLLERYFSESRLQKLAKRFYHRVWRPTIEVYLWEQTIWPMMGVFYDFAETLWRETLSVGEELWFLSKISLHWAEVCVRSFFAGHLPAVDSFLEENVREWFSVRDFVLTRWVSEQTGADLLSAEWFIELGRELRAGGGVAGGRKGDRSGRKGKQEVRLDHRTIDWEMLSSHGRAVDRKLSREDRDEETEVAVVAPDVFALPTDETTVPPISAGVAAGGGKNGTIAGVPPSEDRKNATGDHVRPNKRPKVLSTVEEHLGDGFFDDDFTGYLEDFQTQARIYKTDW